MLDIENLKKEVNEAVSQRIVNLSKINYQKLIQDAGEEYDKFPTIWIDEYELMTQRSNEIIELSDNHFQFLFDYNYERVICSFGKTRPTDNRRDKKRQSGFIPGFTKYYKNKDRGHFLSHCQGGGMDINFFPQDKEINRGWNDAGKIYRQMERFCAKNSGVFCFARPLYHIENTGWIPQQIEYGIIVDRTCLAVVFPN